MKPYRHALIVVALLAVAALAALRMPAPRVSSVLPVALPLPGELEGWSGHDILFCQGESCMKGFRADALRDLVRCPSCGGLLHPLSPAERKALPSDILLGRKQYTRFGQAPVLVTVVVSGEDRTGIHRPQMCLTGQGWGIGRSRVVKIPVPGRAPFRVMLLDVQRMRRGPGDAVPVLQKAVFAYWFLDARHETPYHVERMLWMAADSVARGEYSRWAYVAVLLPGSTEFTPPMAAFLSALHSAVRKGE